LQQLEKEHQDSDQQTQVHVKNGCNCCASVLIIISKHWCGHCAYTWVVSNLMRSWMMPFYLQTLRGFFWHTIYGTMQKPSFQPSQLIVIFTNLAQRTVQSPHTSSPQPHNIIFNFIRGPASMAS